MSNADPLADVFERLDEIRAIIEPVVSTGEITQDRALILLNMVRRLADEAAAALVAADAQEAA